MKFIHTNSGIKKSWIHSLRYIFAAAYNTLSTFILSFIIIKWLTPVQYGEIALLLTYYGFLNIFLPLGMDRAIPRYLFEPSSSDKQLGSIYTFVLLVAAILFIVIAGLYFIIGFSEFPFYIVVLIFTGSLCFTFFSFYKETLVSQQKSRLFSRLNNYHSSLIFIFSIGLTYIIYLNKQPSNFGRIYAPFIANFLMLIVLASRLYKLQFNLNKTVIKYFLKFSAPLLIFTVSSFFIGYIDRILINIILDDIALVGNYNFAYNLGLILFIVIVAINKNLRIEYIKSKERNDADSINKNVKTYTLFILFLEIIILFFTIYIAPLIIKMAKINMEYMSQFKLIPFIIYAYHFYFIYSLFSMEYYYKKQTKILAFINVVAALINLGLNIILLRFVGVAGAAISTIASYLFLAVYVLFKMNKKTLLTGKEIKILLLSILFATVILITGLYLT